jgi:hypothetical protein
MSTASRRGRIVVMDALVARAIAHYSHVDRRDRHGHLVIEHVARVAAAVPAGARSSAWLHDVLEQSDTSIADLRAHDLSPLELEALHLLTRDPETSYELYVLQIAFAPGAAGALARVIKLADLDDHLADAHLAASGPPYAWARRHIAMAIARCDGPTAADALAS